VPKIRRIDFYPDDWLAGTIELDDAERGVFISICMLIYAKGGPIGVPLLRAYSTGHGNRTNRCLARLESLGKIVRNGEEITQKRCENELERARKRLEKAQQNGAKGGRPNGLAKPGGFLSEKTNNQQPTTNIQQESPLRGEDAQPQTGVSHARRGARLAPDWAPSLASREFAESHGLDPDAVFEQFRDYWMSKAGNATKLDWDATFRVWCRNEAGRRKSNGQRKFSAVDKLHIGGRLAAEAFEAKGRARDETVKPLLDC
jgi:uncharacterized protein YdaU (DUF1376 family)